MIGFVLSVGTVWLSPAVGESPGASTSSSSLPTLRYKFEASFLKVDVAWVETYLDPETESSVQGIARRQGHGEGSPGAHPRRAARV